MLDQRPHQAKPSSAQNIPATPSLLLSDDVGFQFPGSLQESKTYLVGYSRKRSVTASFEDILIQLKTEFKAESHKRYLTKESRKKYKVRIDNGFFTDHEGLYLNGIYIYVLLPDYKLYCARISENLQHSYFNRGHKVRGAGILYVENGRLINMSNESGHYKPTFDEMRGAISWFYQQLNGHHFLFEDHSDQDKEKEFNGIKFFHILSHQDKEGFCTHTKELLMNERLLPVLYEIRNAEQVFFNDIYASKFLEGQAQEDDDEDFLSQHGSEDFSQEGVYYSDLVPAEIKVPEDGISIFEEPEFLSFTCLQNIHKKIFSRYGCHLKPSFKI
ncbi:MAG: hypothetical protein AB7V32_01295 [Candidatus Berkiella sp.]